MKKNKLSVVLATHNEENNLTDCLSSIKDIASEIVVVDGSSDDKTVQIAKQFNSKVVITDNPPIFHINKQKALELAQSEWVLQLDADERVTPELRAEIIRVISMTESEIEEYQESLAKRELFSRHQKLLYERDGQIGKEDKPYAAFFLPRLNFFLGKYLKYGGVYPDGVIRLIKNGKARFPCKDVHEQIVVDGRVGWLENDLLHEADKSFKRYLIKNSRYIDLLAGQLQSSRTSKNILSFAEYFFLKPLHWFVLTQIRHKGILDSYQGVIFSFFSALRFPRAYWRYLRNA